MNCFDDLISRFVETVSVEDIPGIPESPPKVPITEFAVPVTKLAEPMPVASFMHTISMMPVKGIVQGIGQIGLTTLADGKRHRVAKVMLVDEANPSYTMAVPVPFVVAKDLQVGQPFGFSAPPAVPGQVWDLKNVACSPLAPEEREIEKVEISFWDAVRGKLWFERVAASEPVTMHLPLYRLHCPKVKGCTANYISRKSETERLDFVFEVAGIGWGKGKQVTLKEQQKIGIEAECIQVGAKAVLQMVYGNLFVGGEQLMSGVKIDVLEIDKDDVKPEPLNRADDRCDLPISEIEKLKQDLHYKKGAFRLSKFVPDKIWAELVKGIAHERKKSFTIGLPLNIAGVPLNVGVACTLTTSSAVEVSCKLAGGKDYFWYGSGSTSPEKSIECFWTTIP